MVISAVKSIWSDNNMLYEYLLKNYKPNEPIFTADIDLDINGNTLRPQFKQLCDQGLLKRFDNGIFFIPSQSRLKGGASIDAGTVARYKYILRRGQIVGYYSGFTFANQAGLTTQVPVTIEIVSNEASAKVRDVDIKGQTIRLRKPKTTVTKENARVLQFLDLLCDIDRLSDEDGVNVSKRLKEIIEIENIKKADIDSFISLYPLKVYKNFYDYGLYEAFFRCNIKRATN